MIARSLIIIALLTGVRLTAATYYAAASGGSSGNPGSYASPWTLNYGVTQVAAGDTLILKDGTYTQRLNLSNKHGAGGSPITFRGESFSGVSFQGGTGTAWPAANIAVVNSSNLTFEDMRLYDPYNGNVMIYASTNITMRRILARRPQNDSNVSGGNHHCFLSTDLSGSRSKTNLFEDCIALEFHRHGFSLGGSDYSTVRRCYYDTYGRTYSNGAVNNSEGTTSYGANFTTMENNYGYRSEYVGMSVNATATATADGAKHYGCIVLTTLRSGITPNSRSTTSAGFITNSVYQDCVVLDRLNSLSGKYRSESAFQAWHGDIICFTNCFAQSHSFAAFESTQDSFFWDADRHAAIWDPALRTKNFQTLINNCVAVGSSTGFLMSRDLGASTTPEPYLGVHTTRFTNNTSFNNNNHLIIGSAPYVVVTQSGFSTADPGYDTATYGDGAYLMRAPNQPARGARVTHQYIGGILTTNRLWPWPMESEILAEIGYSPTWFTNGGLWKTLDDVYEEIEPHEPPAPNTNVFVKVYFAPQDVGGVRNLNEAGGSVTLILSRTGTNNVDALSGTWEFSGDLTNGVHFLFSDGDAGTGPDDTNWTIPAGQSGATFDMTPIPDGIFTSDEQQTGSLTVTAGTGYTPQGTPAYFRWVDAQADPAWQRGPERPGEYVPPKQIP